MFNPNHRSLTLAARKVSLRSLAVAAQNASIVRYRTATVRESVPFSRMPTTGSYRCAVTGSGTATTSMANEASSDGSPSNGSMVLAGGFTPV